MAQGMKRLGMPIAALFGAAVLALIGTSWFLNRDALRQAVEAQIRAVTGLDLIVSGAIDVSVFPGSYVSFHNVGLKGGGTCDPALQVDVLTANLRLLPLLLQRFEIADVMMLRPHIHVVRDADGESNWTPFVERIARTMKPGAENQLSFSEIRIQDGVLKYEDAANHVPSSSATSTSRWPGRRSRARSRRPDNSTGATSASTARSRPAISSRCCRATAPGLKARARQRAGETRLRRHGRQPHQPDDGRHRHRRPPSLRDDACVGSDSRCRPAAGFGRFSLKARANPRRRRWRSPTAMSNSTATSLKA